LIQKGMDMTDKREREAMGIKGKSFEEVARGRNLVERV